MGMPERSIVKKVVPAKSFLRDRYSYKPEYVVIHVTQAMNITSTDNWFTNPACPVSAHYGIGRDGEIRQYVSEYDTAYHAGNRMMNYKSIGIEHAGISGLEFTKEQVDASARLVARICKGYKIPLDNIIRHGSVPGTTHKECPGPTWNMERYKLLVKYYMELM